jgi:hypothetical protein
MSGQNPSVFEAVDPSAGEVERDIAAGVQTAYEAVAVTQAEAHAFFTRTGRLWCPDTRPRASQDGWAIRTSVSPMRPTSERREHGTERCRYGEVE